MSQSSNPAMKVPTRRMDFADALAEVPKHFAGDGDIVTSHVWAFLSSTFPEGEDGFVRSVRHYRDQLTDPVLKRQVAGFIGQEAMHGREHRLLNERLATHGYPVRGVERALRWSARVLDPRFGPEANLASTVAFEHLTALLAERVLEDQGVRDMLGHEAVTELFLWHALEESEHKAVAFDVYRAVGGSERTRVWSMRVLRWAIVTVIPVLVMLPSMVVTDKDARRPLTLLRSIRRFLRSPLITRETWDAIKDFERPDFHPNQRDTTPLLDEWRERLFGAEGSLNGRLVRPTAA